MTPEAALEYASGLSLPTLVAQWRDRVVDARPAVYGNLAPNSGTTLIWVLLLGALAMRSTRWRSA